MTVDDFFAKEMSEPFFRGWNDCCNTVNRWIEINTGRNPADLSGFDISSEEKINKVLTDRNLVEAIIAIMKYSGLPRTKNPKEGDVGIVVPDKHNVSMGIFWNGIWVTRDDDGFSSIPAKQFLRAWSINGNRS